MCYNSVVHIHAAVSYIYYIKLCEHYWGFFVLFLQLIVFFCGYLLWFVSFVSRHIIYYFQMTQLLFLSCCFHDLVRFEQCSQVRFPPFCFKEYSLIYTKPQIPRVLVQSRSSDNYLFFPPENCNNFFFDFDSFNLYR